MTRDDNDTEQLIQQTGRGEVEARERLLTRYRSRLRRMVANRLDRRLAARVDPSDVVQETMLDAARKLDGYLLNPPLPYYPWLHRLASEQVALAHRRHLGVRARSVDRETQRDMARSGATSIPLVDLLCASQTSVRHKLSLQELKSQVHRALERLSETDRELLVMHYLDQRAFDEIAAVLGITAGAAKVRHFRVLARLRPLLDEGGRR